MSHLWKKSIKKILTWKKKFLLSFMLDLEKKNWKSDESFNSKNNYYEPKSPIYFLLNRLIFRGNHYDQNKQTIIPIQKNSRCLIYGKKIIKKIRMWKNLLIVITIGAKRRYFFCCLTIDLYRKPVLTAQASLNAFWTLIFQKLM